MPSSNLRNVNVATATITASPVNVRSLRSLDMASMHNTSQ